MNPDGERTYLLPMAVAEGSPTHPAFPSGHAINVGGYITALKVRSALTWVMPCGRKATSDILDRIINNETKESKHPHKYHGIPMSYLALSYTTRVRARITAPTNYLVYASLRHKRSHFLDHPQGRSYASFQQL